MKTKVNNQASINKALAEDNSSDPHIKFELELTVKNEELHNMSVGEVNGFFLARAIEYIETLDIYDDYDGFSTDSYIQFWNYTNEETTYIVNITMSVEN